MIAVHRTQQTIVVSAASFEVQIDEGALSYRFLVRFLPNEKTLSVGVELPDLTTVEKAVFKWRQLAIGVLDLGSEPPMPVITSRDWATTDVNLRRLALEAVRVAWAQTSWSTL